jgi:HAD superfamily hydrolase (TIGR01509 family)
VIHAIVFDFDGVLADSEPLHLRAAQQVCAAIGVTIARDEYYARYLGYDDSGMFRAIGEANGQQWDGRTIAALVADKARVFDEAMLRGDVLYPGAVECVERMAAEFPLAIASGALKHEIEAILAGAGLAGRFRFIVASGDTAASKPAPDPYRRAAALHGLPPVQCLAIEDSRWGIESAKAAGLKCVGITHSYPAAALAAADAVIESLESLTPAFVREL